MKKPRLGRSVFDGNPAFVPGVAFSPGIYSPMVKGNKLAAKENLTPSAHKRRMAGLYRAWAVRECLDRGEKVKTYHQKKDERVRKRIRLKETVAKEAREIQDIARTRAVAAMNRLAKIIDDPASKDSDAIAAIAVTLDRAYGKASQTHINANIDANGKDSEISDQELKTRIEKAIKRVNELTGGTAKAPESKEQPTDIRERDRDTGGSTLH